MPESRNAWPEFLRDCIAALGCERSAGMEFSRRQMKAVDSRDISGNFSQPLRSFEGVHPGCRVRQLKSASDATDLRRLWDREADRGVDTQTGVQLHPPHRKRLKLLQILAQCREA
ncbi:hypothetical protein K438DRAFT_1747193 [Mycena galopus ATCC 62051]|nr:hypothetical protein K438DRAFT_1747193 [Mycena galopus ATCC 62051]